MGTTTTWGQQAQNHTQKHVISKPEALATSDRKIYVGHPQSVTFQLRTLSRSHFVQQKTGKQFYFHLIWYVNTPSARSFLLLWLLFNYSSMNNIKNGHPWHKGAPHWKSHMCHIFLLNLIRNGSKWTTFGEDVCCLHILVAGADSSPFIFHDLQVKLDQDVCLFISVFSIVYPFILCCMWLCMCVCSKHLQ